MPVMIVKYRIADFDQWKQVFDQVEAFRREHGWIGHEVYRDSADPNLVLILHRVPDFDQAHAYSSSEVVRSAMARAGVQSPPELWLMNEADIKQY